MEINVEKRGAEWMVIFNHEGQYFTLDYRVETKEDAEWMKDMLSKCFDRAFGISNIDPLDDENSEISKIGKEIADMSDEEFDANCKKVEKIFEKK